jgi:hypothetical protein
MEKSGPDKPKYYLKQAAMLTDTESTWIHELIRKNYFQPIQPAEGRGKPNLFSFNDLVKLEVLKVLGKLNLLKTAAVAVVKDTDINKTGRYYSMGPPDGNHAKWVRKFDPKPINDDYTLSFNLDRIKRKLNLRMK